MFNRSHFFNALIFTLSVTAWILVKNYTPLNITILQDVYSSAFAATVVIYIASVIFQNVSLYDTYWGLQGALLSLNYYLSMPNSNNPRSQIATLLSCVWSIRLVLVFVFYSWNDIYAEDWRYRLMRNKTNNRLLFSIRSFFFHYLLPMNIGYFGHVPHYYLSSKNQLTEINVFDIAGISIMVFGIVFETIADYQLRANVYVNKLITSEKSSGTDEKRIMNTGLWSLCRHPNYFGEFCYWFGLFVYGLASGVSLFDRFYLTSFFVGCLMVYMVLNYISIPFMEKRQLKRRPESYKKYLQDVPYSFFPFKLF